MSIRVQAKTKRSDPDAAPQVVGYYDHRRRYEGEEFELAREQDFSAQWMERCGETPAPVAPKNTDALVARLKAGREHKAMQKSQLLEG
jgi:hypothetical protein